MTITRKNATASDNKTLTFASTRNSFLKILLSYVLILATFNDIKASKLYCKLGETIEVDPDFFVYETDIGPIAYSGEIEQSFQRVERQFREINENVHLQPE